MRTMINSSGPRRVKHGAGSARSRNRSRRFRVPAAVGGLILVAALATTLGGCSCRREPEWDSGLVRRESPARQAGGADSGDADSGGPAAGATAQSGSGAGSGGGGNGDGAGAGAGSGGQAGGAGREGGGQNGGGAMGVGTSGASDGAATGGQPVAGNASGEAAGAGDDAAQPPAALPGRPRPRPRYTVEKASQVAERLLGRAEASQRRKDVATAYGEALEAFEAVEPHAATNEACKGMLTRAKKLLAELAESQTRAVRPRAVPTLFE